jgi:hypothetical protein
MMLHAAAVRIDDQLIVLPGESGAGKTTLTANLLAAGAVYLTDELVFVDRKTGLADCLPRPLNIKQPGVGIVTPLLNPGWDDGTIIRSAAVTLLPHRLLNDSGEEYPQHAFRPAAIVFPNFADSARLMMEPLSSARACVRLMGCLVNARNLEKDGLDDCANLSRVVPAWRLNYSAGAAPLQLLREIRGDLRAS